MKPVRSRLATLLPLLLAALGAIFARSWGGDSAPVPVPSASVADVVEGAGVKVAQGPPAGDLDLDLSKITDAAHRAQISRVIEAMDHTGAPPSGVAQGGRRGARKGVFQNAEGRLPRRQSGYWIESDVWPKNGPRGAERLIFGGAREVYWTRDHYETFSRLR